MSAPLKMNRMAFCLTCVGWCVEASLLGGKCFLGLYLRVFIIIFLSTLGFNKRYFVFEASRYLRGNLWSTQKLIFEWFPQNFNTGYCFDRYGLSLTKQCSLIHGNFGAQIVVNGYEQLNTASNKSHLLSISHPS